MTNHSVVKRGGRVKEKLKREMSKRGAADCDVPDREMTQEERRRRRDHRGKEKQKSVTMKGLKKSENKKVAR